MFALAPIVGTDFNDYVVNLLQKHAIENVRELLDSDTAKMRKITNLTTDSLAKIKKLLLYKYAPHPWRMSQLIKMSTAKYKTGISSLDAILAGSVWRAGALVELCGCAGVGKTQLCLTIAVNFASNYEHEVLYIDTKCDMIGTRIYQMLGNRSSSISKTQMGDIMQQIKVECTLSAQGVIEILEKLQFLLQSGSTADEVNNIKCIVIDSLPAVWFLILDEQQRLNGKFLLTRLANLMRQLSAQHGIIFVFGNLMAMKSAQEKSAQYDGDDQNEGDEKMQQNSDDDDDTNLERVASQDSETNADSLPRPALGNYWQNVPTLRLAIQKPPDVEHDVRILRVLKSFYTPSGVTCKVRITDSGCL